MTEADLRDLLNAQTGKISWPELARPFARDVVICVAAGQDLVKIAEKLVQDRAGEITDMYETGALHRARDDDARRWQKEETQFWAVVVAPWVLVQEI